jgi:hypothetical protein
VSCPKLVTTSISILPHIPQLFGGSEIMHMPPKAAFEGFTEYLTQKKMSSKVSCPKQVTTSISILPYIPQLFGGPELVHVPPKLRLRDLQNI